MKSLRKRKIAKALKVRVSFRKCPDDSMYIFFIGQNGGEVIYLEKGERLQEEQFLSVLKKVKSLGC